MIGFLAGAAIVGGLIALKHHHRHGRWAHAGCGHRWHRWHHHHHGHHGHHHGHGPGSRAALYHVLAELDCTPAQERAIRDEVDGVMRVVRELGEERRASRDDLARAVAGADLDRAALDAMFARHDQRLVAVRGEVVAALGRIHAVLDERQRERLADLIRGGGRGHWHGFGPYR